MMKTMRKRRQRRRNSRLAAWIAVAVFAAVLLSSAGCRTGDMQNASAQPWSSPRDWEHGLPSSIMEGR